ncbi:alpha/beta-type small acid-soluble spore protein [Symbiobacterium thermophilum]|uniref:Small acid-soluble spore protein n=1 Tax=Symbiobacterium thermophilum TaxID=2734 RepID=A0A953I081_SYMTR|nr:alpha/beta-type small acid-soluble spore protein [Symbiobacterium thermophilum]MBY6275957.1 small acid-soluble spore protein [Symbiobacterium thermophilum]
MANVFGTGTTGQTGNSSNQLVVSRARAAMEQLKQQTAAELGIHNYDQQYKGDLPSRVNGSVGGYMVKKMIAIAESQLAGGTTTGQF